MHLPMYKSTYKKFGVLLALSFAMGFLGMQFITSEPTVTGMVVVEEPAPITELVPGNMVFLFLGIAAGAAIVASIVYAYHHDHHPHGKLKD